MQKIMLMKIDENYQGQNMLEIKKGLHNIFNEVLQEARGNLAENDLGLVVIHNQGLNDPVVVPLQPLDHLNADVVIGCIENVLNSNQDLHIDKSFEISVGAVNLPKGGARRRITNIKGKKKNH
jgi:hypothetical protein